MHRSRRLGRLVKPIMLMHHEVLKSVSALRMPINHPALARLRRYLPSPPWDQSPLAKPMNAFLEDLEAHLRGGRAAIYGGESGRTSLARAAGIGANVASLLREYPRIRSLARGGVGFTKPLD